ncbi:MAG TPA: hypothetical protein VGE27_18625 [Gemmatimonas sp.]|uniref:WapI family immunity protein n=1 Tax=Gemmatimonas sp. TaxID=1962908 RepID=UPI002EDBA17C
MDIVLHTHVDDPVLALRNCRRLDATTFECELYVRSSGFICERTFWFEEPEFGTFREQLAAMDSTLMGAAELRTRHEENGFRLEVSPTGTVGVTGMLREYGAMNQILRFGFNTDQTVLAPFIQDLTQLSGL